MKILKRWLKYKKSNRIHGTCFVAFKTPLQEKYTKRLSPCKTFTPKCVMRDYPEIKLVIDLTSTNKYYDGKEFKNNGVQYVKLECFGHTIPTAQNYKKFVEIVDNFLETNPDGGLIGVHCTHGVNRTGYLIVKYMIERLHYSPQEALRAFLKFRGHAIERTNYIADLLKIKKEN